MSREEYSGLWRAAAYEAVPYTDDYPEAILVFPEITDGCIGQGKATRVSIDFEFLLGNRVRATIEDDGGGLGSMTRFLSWTAEKSEDNMHRNGHGMKKAMTKLEREFDKAAWEVLFRKRNRDLTRIKAPFLGTKTSVADLPDDETTLMPSGTRFTMEFDRSVLGEAGANVYVLANTMRELLTTRYSEEILRRVQILLTVSEGTTVCTMDSHDGDAKKKWHSLHWWVKRAVEGGKARLVREKGIRMAGCQANYSAYRIVVDGRRASELEQQFPTYGGRNMNCSRVHVSLEGRTIEAVPVYKLYNAETNHNRFNGFLEFVDFVPDISGDLKAVPTPCTTKVSFYENDPVFKAFKEKYTEAQKEPEMGPAAPAAAAAQTAQTAPRPVSPAPPPSPPTVPASRPAPSVGGAAAAAATIPIPVGVPAASTAAVSDEDKLKSWGVKITLETSGKLVIRKGRCAPIEILNSNGHERLALIRRAAMREDGEECHKYLKKWARMIE